ncbi:hypothetical protein [Sphingomonas sp. RB1R13]|uniref:hypothetical protein n=1 Tax=Sphingomonas sp. RB1R13 TaxID=3096159 RepID=UPI002FC89E14
MSQLPAHVAMLAPVPLEHLLSGRETSAKVGKVAFGSRAFEALHKLTELADGAPCDVLIYASDAHLPGPPKVTWRARFERWVEAKAGGHPAGMKYRPHTTSQHKADNHGHWFVFWEVTDLRELPPAEHILISDLKGVDKRSKLAKTFIPLGPIVVEAAD